MGSPLPQKRQAARAPPPPTLPAVYMPADIPAEVDMPPPKRSKDNCGVHVFCDSMEDMFNQHYTSELSTDDTPNPLKRRLRKKNCKVVLLTTLSPILQKRRMSTWALSLNRAPTPTLLRNRAPPRVLLQRDMKEKPVVLLPMFITGQLPHPLGKVVVIHTLCPSQWYDKCETTDSRFMEAAAIACDTLAANCTPKQHGVFHRHHRAIRDVQPLCFPVDVNTPDDICYHAS